MGCSCSGGSGGSSPVGGSGSASGAGTWGGMGGEGGGENVEPFPRQTLIGNPSLAVSYYSPIYDSVRWKSIAWWYECYAFLPGVTGLPTFYLETADVLNGPWTALATQTAAAGERYTGAVEDPGSLVRARVAVPATEAVAVAVRFVARAQ